MYVSMYCRLLTGPSIRFSRRISFVLNFWTSSLHTRRRKKSGDYWRVRDWRRNRTTKMQTTWTCTLRLRCQLRGSHAVSVRVREWRRNRTTKIQINWTCTLRLRLQWGSRAVSGDHWRVCHWTSNRNTKLKLRRTLTCTLRMKSILPGS